MKTAFKILSVFASFSGILNGIIFIVNPNWMSFVASAAGLLIWVDCNKKIDVLEALEKEKNGNEQSNDDGNV